ncbi:acyltransferase family protein, partial [Paraglaciecola sp.]|uniref:acyltransferase family protein n=1 Tax=Paraglaciecola sp. TaxID=1920173 RepID=UPI003EF92725
SIGFSDKYPTASFYLLHTRAWELLAGALVYLYPVSLSSFRGKLIELAGLLLIVICVFSYTTEEIWPGYLAIFPVFGTAMIMLAARSDSIFTNNFIFNWLGKTSYSIYLYHWPVVVLLNYFELIPSGVWIFVGLALSVVLGALSYYLIENKFKYLNRAFVGVNTNSNKRSGVLLCVIVSSLGAIGAAVQHSDGFEARFDKKILIAAAEADNRSLKTKMCLSSPKSSSDHEGCVLGNHQKIKAIIIGDSHANSLATALISSLMDNNAGVLVLARHSCPFILGAKNRNYAIYNCTQANARNIDILQNQYVGIPIFVVNRASGYLYGQTNPRRFQGLSPAIYFDKKYTIVESGLLNDFSRQYEKTACQLAEQNPVFITEPIPEMRLNVPNTMSRRAALSGDLQDIKIDKKLYLERNQFIKKLNRQVQDKCAITVLDTAEYLCDEKFCFGSLDGRPLYSDGDHLSENGNKLLIPMFQEAIEKTPSN